MCTRNDALAGVIADCPPARKGDLVFYGHALALPRASPPAATPACWAPAAGDAAHPARWLNTALTPPPPRPPSGRQNGYIEDFLRAENAFDDTTKACPLPPFAGAPGTAPASRARGAGA